MADIYEIFTSLQKGLQKSHIILPHVLTLRDAAVRKLDIYFNGPAPGGEEQKALTDVSIKNTTIRDRIVKSSKKFLANRLNIEQEKCVQLMMNVISATTCATLIHYSVYALKLFISRNDDEKISSLVSDICEQWPAMQDIPRLDTTDIDSKYSVRLRQMFVKPHGQF